jgi:hypothetical protein
VVIARGATDAAATATKMIVTNRQVSWRMRIGKSPEATF